MDKRLDNIESRLAKAERDIGRLDVQFVIVSLIILGVILAMLL